jgi:hypothetical protein
MFGFGDPFSSTPQSISDCDKEGLDAIYPFPNPWNVPASITCTCP